MLTVELDSLLFKDNYAISLGANAASDKAFWCKIESCLQSQPK